MQNISKCFLKWIYVNLFKGFANQAELDRFDDLGLGARFSEEAAPLPVALERT